MVRYKDSSLDVGAGELCLIILKKAVNDYKDLNFSK
jgi:hypothetical protein